MDSYTLIKTLHIISVITLVGPLVLTPFWLYLYQHDVGKKVIHDIHFITGISGWIVLLSSGLLLWFQDGEMLSHLWMQVSLGLFILLLLFDHFWADRQEEELEKNLTTSVKMLKIWLIIKLGIYFLITVLMIVKPTGSL